MGKVIITLTDKPDGSLDLNCVFEPEITDETRSHAVHAALDMVNWFAGKNKNQEVASA